MSTLYLPTSTLNFNNIFSTETISPASFYMRRGFGYKRFEKVPPNNSNTFLYLYNKVPRYEIIDKDRDNYPMVISTEYDESRSNELTLKDDGLGVLQENKTIYLSPFNTKVIFFDDNHKKQVLAASTRSLETKMVELYNQCGCFCVYSNEPSFNWEAGNIKETPSECEQGADKFVQNDKSVDRLKGFLYSYTLGAYLSLSEELVWLNRLSREIRNTTSSILSSGDDIDTKQRHKLLDKILEFDRYFNNCDAKTKDIFSQIPVLHQRAGVSGLFSDMRLILKNDDEYHRFMQRLKTGRNLYYIGKVYETLGRRSRSSLVKNVNEDINEMEQHVADITRTASGAKRISFSTDDNMRVFDVNNGCISKISDSFLNNEEEQRMLCAIVNDLMLGCYTPRDLNASRLEIAKKAGLVIKNIIGEDKWAGTQTEQYINSLLKNIARGDAFDILSSDSIFLRSFAAFILKGDELEKLKDFLITNSIGDFRIAFGFHGAIVGFSSLPRTSMDYVYLMKDLAYLNSLYKGIYALVHGDFPQGTLRRISASPNSVLNCASLLQNDVGKAFEEFETACKKSRKKVSTCLLDQLKTIVLSQNNGPLISMDDIEAWTKLASPPKTPLKKLISVAKKLYDNTTTTRHKLPAKIKQPELWDNKSSSSSVIPNNPKLFVEDDACITDVCLKDVDLEILPLNIREELAAKMVDFQKDYRPGGFYIQHPDKYNRNNASTIDHFMRCLLSSKTKKLNVHLESMQKTALLNWLKKRYGC